MGNTDKKNGYTEIPNPLLDEVVAYGFSGVRLSVVLYVIRKTYGWHKSRSSVCITQMAKEIRRDRATVSRAISDLAKIGVLGMARDKREGNPELWLRDPAEWERGVTKQSHTEEHKGVTKKSHRVLQNSHTGCDRMPTEGVTVQSHIKEKKERERKLNSGSAASSFFRENEDEDDGGMSAEEAWAKWKEEHPDGNVSIQS